MSAEGFEEPFVYYDDDFPFADYAEEENLFGVEGHGLITRPLFLTPQNSEEEWRHHNILLTTCHIGGFEAKMIIDLASSENVIATKVVQKLKLPM